MKPRVRIIISLVVFILFISAAFFTYKNLSGKYRINNDNVQSQEERIMAPDISFIDINNNKIKLSDFFGKPIVLNFWASWCPPCKSEMPQFNKVYNEKKEDVVFLMIDLVDGQRETADKGMKYVNDMGFTFPIYFDTENEAYYKYGVTSIPSTLFIDKDGYVVSGFKGAIDEETLLQNIEKIK